DRRVLVALHDDHGDVLELVEVLRLTKRGRRDGGQAGPNVGVFRPKVPGAGPAHRVADQVDALAVDGELLADDLQHVHHVLFAQFAEVLRGVLPTAKAAQAATGVILAVLQLLVLLFGQDFLDPGVYFLLQFLDLLLLLVGQFQVLLQSRRQDRARGRAKAATEAAAGATEAAARPLGAIPAAAVVPHRRH